MGRVEWPQSTLVVNLFGGPGCGKSTLASGVFHELKSRGVNCELAHEWVKQKVWEGSFPAQPQYYIWAKQLRSVELLLGKVDVIITDSPTLLSGIYGINESYTFNQMVIDYFNKTRNYNVFVWRVKEYQPAGRNQSMSEAEALDTTIERYLMSEDIDHSHIEGRRESVVPLADDIERYLQMPY